MKMEWQQYSPRDYLDGVSLPECFSERGVKFTLVELEDIGTVGIPPECPKNDPISSEPEDPSSQERTQLGLPLSFSSTKRKFHSKKSKKRPKRRAITSTPDTDPPNQKPQPLPESDQSHETSAIDQIPPAPKERTSPLADSDSSKQSSSAAALRKTYGRHAFKYWLQRYSLFSKFDEGIQIDKQGWYSITPERIAQHHATVRTRGLVLDAFCGCGGNSIQFALQGHPVIAVDTNADRLHMAQHNAQIYNAVHGIDFVLGDVFLVAPRLRPDLIFVSPPWGGPHYTYQDYMTLDSDLGHFILEMVKIMECPEMRDAQMMLYLPRNFDLSSLLAHLDSLSVNLTEIEVMCLNGILKAATVWLV